MEAEAKTDTTPELQRRISQMDSETERKMDKKIDRQRDRETKQKIDKNKTRDIEKETERKSYRERDTEKESDSFFFLLLQLQVPSLVRIE